MENRKLLSGNQAIALGAYEAGVTVGTGYPGTPSTEILESLTSYPGVYTEWSVNEKVAFEVAMGAALSGARTLVTMKHVGLNVAADPLFTASYTGIKGGLVIVNADDPDMHSSQNEQDNRHYAYAAKVPMLEPSDCQEAKDFTLFAYHLSETYDTPVILRTVTRLSHSLGVVIPLDNPARDKKIEGFKRDIRKYVMIPGHARKRHIVVEERMRKLKDEVNTFPLNRIELNDTSIGFITSGIPYTYVKEVFPEASVLKIGVVNPLPEKLIADFCRAVKKVYIVEELDPFFELRIKALGFDVEGKKYYPVTGELSPDSVRKPFEEKPGFSIKPREKGLHTEIPLPPRPPSLCPGCPHREVFKILKKHDLFVTGDIGCYTLGVLPPFTSIDTCVEMGGSIGHVQGIEIATSFKTGTGGKEGNSNTVAVIGDSTFAHSGITGLLNAGYNKRHSLIIVLDNSTTAMTGMQPNPLSGERINGEKTSRLDYRKLGQACGLDDNQIRIVNAYKPAEIEDAVLTLLGSGKLSLLVVQGLCIILKMRRKKTEKNDG
ncbi:MAG: indolepyruvate ferredoxin oxidoreductase subunit alpha [Spirochaetales bacterium]|nr:indolepyruvate ferredoxin oxidoreductase subunit alpha [Spirochaetales bacterium]